MGMDVGGVGAVSGQMTQIQNDQPTTSAGETRKTPPPAQEVQQPEPVKAEPTEGRGETVDIEA